jgi:hypothetical protein
VQAIKALQTDDMKVCSLQSWYARSSV